ncbi:MAG TPA: hypothetical protein VL418_10800 [Devosiaceae bacterium]|nr:hypothetical protein [Devosiaceae bacterium]
MDEIETLGQAYDAGWKLKVRCARTREGLKSKKPCATSGMTLDLATMLWPHGRACPITWLAGRMRCPLCGSKQVLFMWVQPPAPATVRRSA